MEEMKDTAPGREPGKLPWQAYPGGEPETPRPEAPFLPAERRELVLAGFLLAWGLLLCNSVIHGGLNLGFAVGAVAAVITSAAYLLRAGGRLTPYSAALLGLSLVIGASFARSGDGFVKFVMFCFLLAGVNLGLCLLSGKNRHNPAGVTSLADGVYTVFAMAIGQMPLSFRGLKRSLTCGGSAGRKGGAIALGLVIALPVLGILIPLLASADAAFSGLLARLPQLRFGELLCTAFFGIFLAWALYTRAVALGRGPKAAPAVARRRRGVGSLTVNTVLAAVALVYGVYLASQLAYFVGGFSGILPQGFTMAEYARRGFFEMAWLCAINLGIMAVAIPLAAKEGRAPLSTRVLCLFIGVVTLFLVASASAKMFLYIGAYGLTRLRVLTEVIMIWLGLTALFVMVWLFAPKMPYMKAVMLSALILGAAVAWADVDTVVTRYNVTAYQSGQLETVDLDYLSGLSSGAVPYIARLTEDADPAVADQAKAILENWWLPEEDFRGWNYGDHGAREFLGGSEAIACG